MNKIIQCPSCNTKFALNSNQLAGIESPKFHCSRCNTIFSVDSEPDEAPEDLEIIKQSIPEEQSYFETDPSEENEESLFEDELTQDDLLEPELDTSEILHSEETNNSLDLSKESFFDDDEFEDPEIEVDLSSFSGRILEEQGPKTEILPDTLSQTNIEDHDDWKIGDQTMSAFEENISTASQLSLNYQNKEPLDSREKEFDENIEIDWPTDDGSKSFEVNLSEKAKDGLIPKNIISNSPTLTISSENYTRVDNKPHGEKKTNEYERPEVKSLLASLIGEDEDIDEVKHKPNSFSPVLKKDPTMEVAVRPEDSNLHSRNMLLENSEEIETKNKPEIHGSSNLQNRSFKETTVLKRDQISFGSISEIDEEDDDKDIFSGFKPTTPKKSNFLSGIVSKFSSKNFGNSLIGNPGVFKTFLFAWSLPIFTLIILAWFANSIVSQKDSNSTGFSKKVIEAFGLNKAPSDILPPSDVVVSKIDGTILNLNSGERIVLTSGNILNMSPQSYRNIKIEARIFDKNQISLTRKIAIIPNKLSKKFIKSKSFEVLDAQQNLPLNGLSNEILQKTITEFLIAIDITGFEKELSPKFFGVRVYSVSN